MQEKRGSRRGRRRSSNMSWNCRSRIREREKKEVKEKFCCEDRHKEEAFEGTFKPSPVQSRKPLSLEVHCSAL